MEVILFTGRFFLWINCRHFHGLSALRYSFQILKLRLFLIPRSVLFRAECSRSRLLQARRYAFQAASLRPLTSEAWLQSLFIPCGVCGGYGDTGTGFSPNISVFPSQYYSTKIPWLLAHVPQTPYNLLNLKRL
jgi:hypothetical protein